MGDMQGQLQRVTPLIDELAHDQWLVSHQDERFVPEVRWTIDRLYEALNRLHNTDE